MLITASTIQHISCEAHEGSIELVLTMALKKQNLFTAGNEQNRK